VPVAKGVQFEIKKTSKKLSTEKVKVNVKKGKDERLSNITSSGLVTLQ
jgi:hypothetical protein